MRETLKEWWLNAKCVVLSLLVLVVIGALLAGAIVLIPIALVLLTGFIIFIAWRVKYDNDDDEDDINQTPVL